jgi:Flp pilus assembly protein CpaB
MPRWLRGLLALVAGVVLVLVVLAHTHGPRLARVPVLLANVAPGSVIPSTDIAWDPMVTPPPDLATHAQFGTHPVAVIPLRAGQLVTLSDLAPAPGPVATPTEVSLTVAVKGAASGLVTPGQRVDVWSLPAANTSSTTSTSASGKTPAAPQPTLLLIGARVLMVATASGTPVAGSGSSGLASGGGGSSGIGLVTLAVPKVAVAAVLAAPSVYLVPDATPTRVTVAAK